jgi:hypothetical protein
LRTYAAKNKKMVDYHLHLLRKTRENMLRAVEDYSLERLNAVPTGFGNNLIWNIGHVIVTQQLLTYSLSGLTPLVREDIIAKYRKGTKPDGNAPADEWEYLQETAFALPDQTWTDYQAKVFQQYSPYTTSYGVILNSVEDAIVFNNLHESMHFGNVLSMRKLV